MNRHILKLFAAFLLISIPNIAFCQTELKASVAFDQGDYEAAIKLYSMAADRTSDKNEASTLRAKASVAERAKKLRSEGDYAWNHGYYSSAQEKYSALLKLNPNDPQAKYRQQQWENKNHLYNAMLWYQQGDYEKALEFFAKAGPSAEWSTAEQDAYRQCLESVDYSAFNSALSIMRESKALTYLERHPQGKHVTEVKNWLYGYYTENKNYSKAAAYATTTKQKEQAQKGTKKQSRNSGTSYSGSRRASSEAFSSWGLGLETAPLGSVAEIALPVEVRIFKPESILNISLGARISARGMISRDNDAFFDSDSNCFNLKHRMGYYQIAPYAKIDLLLLETFYLSYGVRMDINFGHSYSVEKSEVHNDKVGRTLSKGTYRPGKFMSPISFTGKLEFGLGDKLYDLYLYISHNLTPPTPDASINNAIEDQSHPLHEAFTSSDFVNKYTKSIYFGIGMRIFFNED